MCIPQPALIKRCSLCYTSACHVSLGIIKHAVNVEIWTGLPGRFKEEGALHIRGRCHRQEKHVFFREGKELQLGPARGYDITVPVPLNCRSPF